MLNRTLPKYRQVLIIFMIVSCYPSLSFSTDTDSIIDPTLAVGVKETPPFIIREPDGSLSGLSIYLWEKIAANTGLRYEFREYDDLSSILTAVENREIDLAISPVTVTDSRLQIMDFSQPFYISSLGVASHQDHTFIQYLRNIFSMQFFKAVLLLVGIILTFGILIWLAEHRVNKRQFPRTWKGLGSGFWWSAVTMTTVGYGDKAPKTPVGRIVAFIWMFSGIIIISGLTAGIASSLTVNSLGINVQDHSNLRKMDLGTVKASSSEAYLKVNRLDAVSYLHISDAFEALRENEIDAFVYDKPVLQFLIIDNKLEGSLHVLPKSLRQDYYSFAFPKGSGLKELIDPALISIINARTWKLEGKKYELDQ